MTIFYYEIIQERKGWLRIDADSKEAAEAAIKESGFEASGVIGYEAHEEVTIEGGGEEVD